MPTITQVWFNGFALIDDGAGNIRLIQLTTADTLTSIQAKYATPLLSFKRADFDKWVGVSW